MEFLSYARRQWDRLAAAVAVLIGLIALVIGYYGVSGTKYLVEQIPYIVSGAVFGIFALGFGAMLWLSADLRDEWRKLDDLERVLTASRAEPVALPAVVGPLEVVPPEPITLALEPVPAARPQAARRRPPRTRPTA